MDAKASPQGTVHKATWSTQALIGELSPKKGVECDFTHAFNTYTLKGVMYGPHKSKTL